MTVSPLTPKPNTTPTIFPAMTVSATDVDNLVNLMRTVSYKLLLDLNLLLSYGIQWDPTNTADLLGYVNKMKYHDVFNFELGNGKVVFSLWDAKYKFNTYTYLLNIKTV